LGVPLIFASLAEFERDLIRERTRAGLDADRRRGRVGGRKTVLTAAKERQACRMLAEGATNHGNHATVELAQPATRGTESPRPPPPARPARSLSRHRH